MTTMAVTTLVVTCTGTVYSLLAPFRYQRAMEAMEAMEAMDRTRIQELEEEILRLKREMRICGIRTSSYEDKKDSP